MPTFIAATNEHIHLRTAHSKLNFYGVTELGGQNEVVHIWEYDHYAHRQKVRAALGADQVWQDTYFSHIREWMSAQHNLIMKEAYGFPFEPFEALEKNAGGVPHPKKPVAKQPRAYELRSYTIKPGKRDDWWTIISAALPARSHYNKPLGVWRTSI